MDESNLRDAQIIENLKQQNKELKHINHENIECIKQLDKDQLTGLFTKEAFLEM